jgi:hypothetical protein
MLWEQEVAGSNPATPTASDKGFRVFDFEAFFYLHSNLHSNDS